MDKSCANCVHVREGLKYHCLWEEAFLPPPVRRERNWGKRVPETHPQWAEKCGQYEEKTDE